MSPVQHFAVFSFVAITYKKSPALTKKKRDNNKKARVMHTFTFLCVDVCALSCACCACVTLIKHVLASAY